MNETEFKYCPKCNKTMKSTEFYQNRDGTKAELCKKCLTMHIDNFDPETYVWILKQMDYPYVPEEWNTLRTRAQAKNPNLNGTSVFGKYMSKMKLKQFKDLGWEDSERLQEEQEAKRIKVAAEREEYERSIQIQYENGEISESQYKTLMSSQKQNEEQLYAATAPINSVDNPFSNPNDFIDDSLIPDLGADLTDEDKIYLTMKWGKYYKPSEWVMLEKNYNDMTKSFDIQDADTKNTLILICKNNLKMNQAIDSGDNEDYQKLSRVYDTLRKSAKFTAAQNKAENENFVDCVGNLVAYCEKNGGKIPKYEITTPLDIVDKVIDDLKSYTRDLIYEDTALAKQIEEYLKKRENMDRQKKDKEEAKAKGLDYVELDDEDYQEYYNEIESQKESDAAMLDEELGEE